MADTLTDPAAEFATLGTAIRSFKPTEQRPCFQVLPEFVGVGPTSPRLYEILGAVGARASRLIDFTANVQDPFIDKDLREAVSNAATQIAQVVNPQCVGRAWKDMIAEHVHEQHIRTLKLFSRTAREYRPLRLISEAEKKQLLAAIDDVVTDIGSDDVPTWAKAPVLEGLSQLKVIIAHLPFFGHEAAIDGLLLLKSRVEGVAEAITQIPPQERSSEFVTKLSKALGVVAMGTALITAPHNLKEASRTYLGWAQAAIEGGVKSGPPLIASGIEVPAALPPPRPKDLK